jgi:RNA polymerase sigma-70 factor (ECF subfamily)
MVTARSTFSNAFMQDDNHKKGAEWERFRAFLEVLVRARADDRWRGKIDMSGIVQQTLLEAFQAGEQLAGTNDAQKAGWLKRALANNLADEIRKLNTVRRDAGRERSLEAAIDDSISRMEALLPNLQATPSQEAVRAERLLQLTQALSDLPEAQRRVIELHHLRGQTLAEVAEALNTSRPAVAGLLHRGLKRLRQLLEEQATKNG